MKTTELITVPTFTFNQGEFGETDWEKPIQVSFYNGQIELRKTGNTMIRKESHFIQIILCNCLKKLKNIFQKHLKC